ncbi:MAG: glycosyltransferase family 2 protein [Actinobacteria bacterium]|nr:glycosyltransferase family 2 protein [Actinomycetota bacterium]
MGKVRPPPAFSIAAGAGVAQDVLCDESATFGERRSRAGGGVKLVAVVLNWNGGEDVLRALDSLAGTETVCVDNDSTDGSDARVERRFPRVELVRTGVNLGFAGGNNVGIRRALARGADWILLLNNDAVAEPRLAEALERAAAARPDAGILACKVLFEDGATVQYAGASFNAALGYSGRRTGYGQADRYHDLRDVDRADGAAMALSSKLVERVGMLDEELHLYVEDVELSLRARAAGFAVVFVPDAVVRHKGSSSTGGSASTTNMYYSTRNTIAVVERHRPLPRGLRGARRVVVTGTHLAQAVMHPRRAEAASAVLRGWRDARRGRLGQRSSR